MNELTIFNNPDFGNIRTTTINGEPWLVGKDVAKALGYKDTSDALKKHVDAEDKLTRRFADSGQNRKMFVINESGLYALILSSKLPKAKEFKHWVTAEVLPSIRKNGGYLTAEAAQQMMNNQQRILERLERLENRRYHTSDESARSILYIPSKQEVERRRLLFRAAADLAGATDMTCNSILHQLYVVLERTMKVSIDDCTNRYRMETGNPSGSPQYMIAANDELYHKAEELLESALRRFSVFA